MRQPNAVRTQTFAATPAHEQTPEERRVAAAYQREQEAIQAPTSTRNSATSSFSTTPAQPASNDLSQVEALSRALGARQGGDSATLPNGQTIESEYDAQNMQSRKEAFLAAGRNRQAEDYLRSTTRSSAVPLRNQSRLGHLSVLEQSLNSDLPGELKALVTSEMSTTRRRACIFDPQGSLLFVVLFLAFDGESTTNEDT